jgi:hypothetical protein
MQLPFGVRMALAKAAPVQGGFEGDDDLMGQAPRSG